MINTNAQSPRAALSQIVKCACEPTNTDASSSPAADTNSPNEAESTAASSQTQTASRARARQAELLIQQQLGGVLSVDNLSAEAIAKTDPQGALGEQMTVEQLRKIVPSMTLQHATGVLPYLNRAMAEANIDTPARQAAFVAQLAHESGAFKYREEIASGADYEGRTDLGNTQRGDGRRYKGRGFIQLTGRANYREAGKALGLDLENNPALAATPANAARVAAWYWSKHNLNELADQGRFDAITRRINGGYNGKADRDRYHARAKRALAQPATSTQDAAAERVNFDLSSKGYLAIGDKSPTVEAIQNMLRSFGRAVSPSGIFDEATRNAVREFQRDRQLTPPSGHEGHVGATTLACMLSIVS